MITASFALVLFLVGHVLAWQHESAVRHVTCAEHGEELHAVTVDAVAPSGEARFLAAGGGAGEHQDCTTARLLRTSAVTPDHVATGIVELGAAFVSSTPPGSWVDERDVLELAPKTSPPRG